MFALKPNQFNKFNTSSSLDNLLDTIDYNKQDRNKNELDTCGVLKRKNAIKRVNITSWETAEDLNDSKTIKYTCNGRVKLIRRNAFRRSEERNSLNSGFIDFNDVEVESVDYDVPAKKLKKFNDIEAPSLNKTRVKLSRSCDDILDGTTPKDNCASLNRKESFASLKDIESKMEDLGQRLISDINLDSRNLMVQWLIGMTDRMSVDEDILYFTVSIMDRFLQSDSVDSEYVVSLPLLASSCLSLACKNRPKHLRSNHLEMFQKAGFKLNFQDVLRTEETIVNGVKAPLCRPLSQPVHFLRRYCRAALLNDHQNHLANFVLEATLFCPVILNNSAPLVAASALFVARNLNLESLFGSKTVYYSEHSDSDITRVVKDILKIILNTDKLQHGTLFDKYAKEERMFVSLSKEIKREVVEFLWDELFLGA